MNLVIDSTITSRWIPGPAMMRGSSIQTSPLLPVSPGPARILQSSKSLPWNGFLVEKHYCSPGERTAASTDRHTVSLLCGRSARTEYCNGGSRLNAPGTLTVAPAGPLPDVRLHTPAEFLHCAFEGPFLLRVAAELNP